MKFPVALLIEWFYKHARELPWRKNRTFYSVWVSEVMLQQTRTETVSRYFAEFLKSFPSIEALAESEWSAVLKAWEGMGYYQRARNLHKAVKLLQSDPVEIPLCDSARFRSLPGVGPYIHAAVMSIACGMPVPVVDGNVLRVYSRWLGIRSDIRRISTIRETNRALQSVIPRSNPGDFNEAMMELGAVVCLPQAPRCWNCPLQDSCYACTHGKTTEIPVRSKRGKVPLYDVALALMIRGERFFIQKRPDEGHLGGLWEFPGGKANPGEPIETALIRECREELGILITEAVKIAEVSHAYTHFRIHIHLFACKWNGEPAAEVESRWIHIEDQPLYPFPAANHKLFPAVRRFIDKEPGE